jgi:hypothetical protein
MYANPIRELASHDIGTVVEALHLICAAGSSPLANHDQALSLTFSYRSYLYFKFTSGFLPEVAAEDVVYHFLRFKPCFCMFCNAHDSASSCSGRIILTADDPT